jgi:hypothetical protein
MGGIGITPYAAGQFTAFDLPTYAEQAVTGANTFCAGLRIEDRHRYPQRTRPGKRLRACHRIRREEMAERLVRRRHHRG